MWTRADHRGQLRIDRGLIDRFGGLLMRSAASALRSAPSSSANQSCTQLRSFSPYWWSRNPSTVERWACGECAFGAAGCEALGSGSMCRWRRSAVIRIPAFRAGDSRTPAVRARDRDGRKAATRVGRHSQRSERLNASSAEAAGGGVGGKRGIVDGAQLHRWSNCHGVVTSFEMGGAGQRDSILDYRCR